MTFNFTHVYVCAHTYTHTSTCTHIRTYGTPLLPRRPSHPTTPFHIGDGVTVVTLLEIGVTDSLWTTDRSRVLSNLSLYILLLLHYLFCSLPPVPCLPYWWIVIKIRRVKKGLPDFFTVLICRVKIYAILKEKGVLLSKHDLFLLSAHLLFSGLCTLHSHYYLFETSKS